MSTDRAAFGLLFTVAPGGPSGLPSDTIFSTPGVVPTAGAAGSALLAGDLIDGFSQRKTESSFLLCFSVDDTSVGDSSPIAGFPPFNVTDQAAKGQAAGDAFISTEAFDRTGILPSLPSMGLSNNVLAINQSPVYVDDFGLLPLASPAVPVALPLDDVVGGGGGGGGTVTDLFFTLDSSSASIAGGAAPYLGGRGADIFFDPTPDIIGSPTAGDETLFATSFDLGLDPNGFPADEIDALAVFDDDLSATWSKGDQVLFSLAAGSGTLSDLGLSSADVLSVTYDGTPTLFASYGDLGLSPGDELDMLELVPLIGTAEQTIQAKVPEPTSLALLALGGLMLARRHRQTQ